MPALPFKYLTKKQLKALKRSLDRAGYSTTIKKGTCRTISSKRVTVCHDSRGHYVAESPHRRARARGASRSQRMSDYYQDR